MGGGAMDLYNQLVPLLFMLIWPLSCKGLVACHASTSVKAQFVLGKKAKEKSMETNAPMLGAKVVFWTKCPHCVWSMWLRHYCFVTTEISPPLRWPKKWQGTVGMWYACGLSMGPSYAPMRIGTLNCW